MLSSSSLSDLNRVAAERALFLPDKPAADQDTGAQLNGKPLVKCKSCNDLAALITELQKQEAAQAKGGKKWPLQMRRGQRTIVTLENTAGDTQLYEKIDNPDRVILCWRYNGFPFPGEFPETVKFLRGVFNNAH